MHEEQKNIKCKMCNMEFRHNNSYKRHMMQHTGERPYECAYCDMAFKRRDGMNAHMKKSHPEDVRIAAAVASATEDETDTEAVAAVKAKPYLAPQPQTQQITQPPQPQITQPQIIASAPQQPQVLQPFPLVQPQQQLPMYTQVVTAGGQVVLVPMDNLTYAQPQIAQPQTPQITQPLFIENLQPAAPTYNIQPAFETIEVLPAPPQQVPVVVQQQQVEAPSVVTSSSKKQSSPVEVIDLSGSDDEDDPPAPAPPVAPTVKNTLEIAMREITGLEVKVEVAAENEKTQLQAPQVSQPQNRHSKLKSDMGTNTEASSKSGVVVKKEECKDVTSDVDNNIAPAQPHTPQITQPETTASAVQIATNLDQSATTPELPEPIAEVEPLEGEDGDDDERRERSSFKGDEIVDKSADLKRVDSKSSPAAAGGLPAQIAAESKSEEFRCDRCGKVYGYPAFLKVHQRRPCT